MPSPTRRAMLQGASLLASAALLRPAEAQQIVLRASITPSIFGTMFDEMWTAFHAAHPQIKIEVDGATRNQDDAFQALSRRGVVADLPDLSFQGYNHLRAIKERGWSVRLEPFIAQDARWRQDGLSGAVQATGTFDGEVHALGAGLSFPIIYVNAALARRAGADPENLPGDWSGLFALARQIGSLGGSVQGGFFQYVSTGNWTWTALIEAQSGEVMTADRRLTFTGAEGMRALEIIRAFGEVGQSRYDVGQEPARTVFGSGAIGVMVDASSVLASFERAAEGRFEIRTAPLPVSGPRPRIPAAGVATVLHTRDPARQRAAWTFMRFVSSLPGQTVVGRHTGYSVPNSVALGEATPLSALYRERRAARAGNATAERAGPWFAFPGENSVKVTAEIRDHLEALVRLQTSPAETMQRIERTVRALVPGVV